jgi:hypothetical protein
MSNNRAEAFEPRRQGSDCYRPTKPDAERARVHQGLLTDS